MSELLERDGVVTEDTSHLDAEYDEIFSGEDSLQNILSGIKSKLSITKETLDLEFIIVPDFKKNSRVDTVGGLSGLLTKYGILNPVHVLKLEDEDSYMLLDGLRRVFGAIRNKETEIEVYVWDFVDKDEGKNIANLISLMLNRSQIYTAKEQWNMLQILEGVNNFTPGSIEYLLQLAPGEAMKLKDVMMSDNEYAEIKDKLLDGSLSIDNAYKRIINARKKEDRMGKDEYKELEVAEDGNIATDTKEAKKRLDLDEVKEILEMTPAFDEAEEIDDLNMTNEIRGMNVQDTDARRPVPREIKQGTFIRDKFNCQCCLLFGGAEDLDTLIWHHVIPVSAGGPDTIENGLTLCQNCHMQVHNYTSGDCVVDVKTLPEQKREKFKRIFYYGNIAIKAYKKLGLKNKDDFKDRTEKIRHAFPNENLRENRELYALSENK